MLRSVSNETYIESLKENKAKFLQIIKNINLEIINTINGYKVYISKVELHDAENNQQYKLEKLKYKREVHNDNVRLQEQKMLYDFATTTLTSNNSKDNEKDCYKKKADDAFYQETYEKTGINLKKF